MSTPITTPTTLSITTQKSDVVAEYQALLDNMDTLIPGVDPFLISGQSVPRAELKSKLQARIDAAAKTKADRKTVAADVAAERAAAAAAEPLRKGVRAFCMARFGATSPILQQLGFVQHRTPKPKVANKAAGHAKATQTKKATGPKGKQQRAAAKKAAAAEPQTQQPQNGGGGGGNGANGGANHGGS